VGPPRVTVLAQGETSARTGEWNTLLAWAASPAPEWHHASGLAADRLEEVASASGVSHALVEAALHESSYPRIESGARWTALTVSLPDPEDVLRRDPILLLVSGSDILSLVRHPLDLPEPPAGPGALAWGPRCALHVLGRVLDRNEDLAGRLEREVRALEELPAAESPAQFFEQTFRLKRSLSTAKGDLWRLRGLLEMLADGRRTLPGLGPEQGTLLRRLAEQADYLYETVDGILDALLSLIDLHINIAAHDMNRFMRLLAIVSALALIPAITGGLLGMNLGDSPWPMTLGQVAFCTLILMLGVLYAFQAKGWIR
jgi:Mg2+ and Co2+ transporter CorA